MAHGAFPENASGRVRAREVRRRRRKMYASVAANSANSAPPTAASAMVEVDSDFDEGIALGAVVSLPYGAGISGEDVGDIGAVVGD